MHFLLAAEEIALQTGLPVGWNSFQISKSYAMQVLNNCQKAFQGKTMKEIWKGDNKENKQGRMEFARQTCTSIE